MMIDAKKFFIMRVCVESDTARDHHKSGRRMSSKNFNFQAFSNGSGSTGASPKFGILPIAGPALFSNLISASSPSAINATRFSDDSRADRLKAHGQAYA